MKLMTYNILNGGQGRLPKIIEVVKGVGPDFLVINEANGWVDSERKVLKEFAQEVGMPKYEIALSGQYDYHVAMLCRCPFSNLLEVEPLMRACVLVVVNTNLGKLAVAGLHLAPDSEDVRLGEIELIMGKAKNYKFRVLLGDVNSLSGDDGYNPEIVESFNQVQLKKFTSDGSLRFDVAEKIKAHGYVDTAVQLGKNKQPTAPTVGLKDENEAHSDMRLDYIFVSNSLLPYLSSYQLVKNELTEKASDHYPVVVELEGVEAV